VLYRRRWFAYVLGGLIAVAISATFFIMRLGREIEPITGSVHIKSMPPGCEVYFNGTRLTDKTPLTVVGVPIGTRHEIRVEMPHHKPYSETIDIPKSGGEVAVTAMMALAIGQIIVFSKPSGADIVINGQFRGVTPTMLTDVDIVTATKLELKLKGYQPFVTDLQWPSNGQLILNETLSP